MTPDTRHQCLIYKGSPFRQLPALAALIREKRAEGFRCLYLNSPAMIEALRVTLAMEGMNVDREVRETNLILSTETAVSEDGQFDIDTMMSGLEEAVDQAVRDGYKGLFATGDMTWEFGSKESFAKLLAYEWRLEKLFHKRPELCGVCQYHSDTLSPEILQKALVSHPAVFINETLTRINEHYAQSEAQAEAALGGQKLQGAIDGLLAG